MRYKYYVRRVWFILASKISLWEKMVVLKNGVKKVLFNAPVSSTVDKERFLNQLFNVSTLWNYDINLEFKNNKKVVWFFFSKIDSRFIFGGWIAVLNFINSIRDRGIDVGVITRESNDFSISNNLLKRALGGVEIKVINDGGKLEISRNDDFIAYDWTCAMILTNLKRRKYKNINIHYFCQEDESIFYPNGSYSSLVDYVHKATADGDLNPIYNSKALKNYFVLKYGGILQNARYFEQAIPKFEDSDIHPCVQEKEDRIVLYGRPEWHAERNMFELGLVALSTAINAEPEMFAGFEIVSLGSDMLKEVPLAHNIKLEMIPRLPYQEYITRLSGAAVAIALMNAPHPSVPPFECVRNGVRTVVNSGLYQRSDSYYWGLNEYFYPADGDPQSLAEAIISAIKDYREDKTRSSNPVSPAPDLSHPCTWDVAFNDLFDKDGALNILPSLQR